MQHRHLGRWGVQVSAVSLGSWLTYGGSVEAERGAACVERAYDLGVTFFDTANVYTGGRAEVIVGQALAGKPRESFVLATKVYFPMGRGPNERGLSRKHVHESCRASLRRMGVDYMDLLQCHRYDTGTPLEETCRVMDDLIRQGKVLYWGVSEWSADQIAHAVSICRAEGWSPPVSNQPQYSLLWRGIEKRVLPTCADLGLGNVVWSPLAQGVLTGKYRRAEDAPEGSRATTGDAAFMRRFMRQDVLDAVAAFADLAREAGCTPAQLALAWCLRQPSVSSVIVGATRPEQLDDTVAAADLALDPAVVERAGAILEPVADTGS